MSSSDGLKSTGDLNAGRTFPCEQCGADLTFHIGAQSLQCGHCGFQKSLSVVEEQINERDLAAALANTHKALGPSLEQASEVHCDACGANTIFEKTLTAKSCAYCGAPLQKSEVKAAESGRLPIDAMLTFKVERTQANSNLTHWVKSRWFAPNSFKRSGAQGKLNAVYLPFYTFDAMTATAYSGARGDHYTVTVGSGNNRRTETRTRWTPASGEFQRFFDDVLVPAFSTLPTKLLESLEPWPLNECRPYTREAVAGSVAHTYDVELPQGLARARSRMEQALESQARQRIGGDAQRIDCINSSYSAMSFKHLMLPTWLLAYRYGEKSYRVAINACSGEVVGERPYSPWKIGFAVLMALLVVLLVISQQ